MDGKFFRGIISKYWKTIQHKYYVQIQRKDVHAVDKWARMIIKELLEFNRTMWKNRCNLITLAKTATYDERQRQDTLRLHQYLLQTPDIVPDHAQHYLQKDETFFQRATIDNILMWRCGIQTGLDNPNSHKNGNMRRFFKRKKPQHRKTRKKKKTHQSQNQRNAPTTVRRPRNTTKSLENNTEPKPKKAKTVQSYMTKYLQCTKPIDTMIDTDVECLDTIHPTAPPHEGKKRKLTKQSEHMMRYMKRLKTFQINNGFSLSQTNSGFKRHIEVPPTSLSNSPLALQNRRKKYCHRNNPKFRTPGSS